MTKQSLQDMLWAKTRNTLEHAEPNIPVMGIFGLIGFPLFYYVWAYIFPQPYENLGFRLIIALLSIPWVLYHRLPSHFKAIFPVYMIISCWIMIPFFFSFMLLKNEWSMVWAISTMAGLSLLILLLNDWVLLAVLIVSAYAAAEISVSFLDGYTTGYADFQLEYIPLFLFGIVGSIIFSHKRQIAQQSKISLLHSLSGSIAHEMRNPLSTITNAMGSIQTILPDKPKAGEHNSHYNLSRSGLISLHSVIDESSEIVTRANKIIDSILASMQGKSIDPANFKRLSVKTTANYAINSYSYASRDEKELIHDSTTDDFEFFGDKDLFSYVIFNLLKNALHYKNIPGFRIDFFSIKGPVNNIIKIRDTGPGIASGKLQMIFDSFYTSGKKGGIGLGLSFCKRVIEAFGGTIVCDSKEKEWTEFTITLPYYSSRKTEKLKKIALSEKKILVVDDNATTRAFHSKLLTEWKCLVDQAINGVAAIQNITDKEYDLVLMDIEMPVLDGDEAAKQIRSEIDTNATLEYYFKNVPIIGISSLPQESGRKRSINSGMNDFIPKPLTKNDIINLFEKYFFSEKNPVIYEASPCLEESIILLVDDNTTSRKFMSIMLERMGAHVIQAENGQEAIECLEQKPVDLVFMDMEMPVLNGVEATRIIRSGKPFTRFSKFRELPIIALTGNTDSKNIAIVKQSGMNAHLGKPVSKDDLVSVFCHWLKDKTSESSLPNNHSTANTTAMDTLLKDVEKEQILNPETIEMLRETGGNELLEELIRIYIDDAQKLIDGIVEAEKNNDNHALNQLSHTLKGSSGSVGAQKMHVFATHLNHLSKIGDQKDYSQWVSSLHRIFEETIVEFENLKTSN